MTEPVDNVLEHYGTKGMRWGVRRDERALSEADKTLNLTQRSRVRIASSISSLAAVGMASNAAATLFQLQSRFEHLRVLKEVQRLAEHSPYINDAGREALRQSQSHIVKGLVGSAIGATAISVAVGIATRRTAKAYFAPLHKVYGDEKPKINKDLKKLSKDIKDGKRPKLTKKQYETEVANIVRTRMTADASNALRPFHELARSQLGTEFNTKDLKVRFEKLPNTDLVSKMTITTPSGIKLVKAIKNVEHADQSDILAPDLELFFDYKFDSDGHVIDWSCPTLEIAEDLFEGRFDVAEITKKFDPSSNLKHVASVEEFLEHYGTKGMKWGVRKNIQRRSGSARSEWVKEKDAKWVDKVGANPKISKVARIAARDSKRQIKKLKKEHKDAGLNVKKNGLARTRYDSEVASILQQSVDRASYKVHKTSPTGLKEVQIHRHPDGSISATIGTRDNAKIRKQQRKIAKADKKALAGPGTLAKTANTIQTVDKTVNSVTGLALTGAAAYKLLNHADNDIPTAEDFEGLEFRLVLDNEGFVDDVLTPFDDEGELEQSEMSDENVLQHYGVRGMRWGVRKDRGDRSAFKKAAKAKGGVSKTSGKPPWQSAPQGVKLSGRQAKKLTKEINDIPSEDAIVFNHLRTRAAAGGVKSLSNDEIRVLTTRAKAIEEYRRSFPAAPPPPKSKKAKLASFLINEVLVKSGETALKKQMGKVADQKLEDYLEKKGHLRVKDKGAEAKLKKLQKDLQDDD